LLFVGWVIFSRVLNLDVIFTARAAAISAIPFVALAIFVPLWLRYPAHIRQRGFVVQWFCIALFFNIAWEVPQLVFKSTFAAAAHTPENLPLFIAWWGYGSADLDYVQLTQFFVLAEISWWVANILAITGLVQLWRGAEAVAFVLLGVCGALQIYNVFFFIAYGGIVEGFNNIATDSLMAPILYWSLNVIWGIAGGIASVLAFVCLFRLHDKQ